MVEHTSDEDLYQQTARTEFSTVSDATLVKLWTSWSVLFALSGAVSFMVWIAILLNRKARQSPFNQYLLFLMFPDWFYTFACATTCAMNAANGSYWSFSMCQWQSWYCMWGISANAWLNGALAREIHVMLKSTLVRKFYQPPTTRKVLVQSAGVYMLSGATAALGILAIPFYPVDTSVNAGITCFPRAFDRRQMFFMWLVFMPLFVILPYLYVLYAVADIYARNLVPPRGKRRLLTFYFFRIVGVFLVFWGPLAFFFFLLNDVWVRDDKEIVVVYVLAAMAHFQAAVSAIMAMTKPDVWACTLALWTCSSVCGKGYSSSSEGFTSRPSNSMQGRRSAFQASSDRYHHRDSSVRLPGEIMVSAHGREAAPNTTYESVVETWKDIPVMTDQYQFEDETEQPAFTVATTVIKEEEKEEARVTSESTGPQDQPAAPV